MIRYIVEINTDCNTTVFNVKVAHFKHKDHTNEEKFKKVVPYVFVQS